jgi:hypothetical protein
VPERNGAERLRNQEGMESGPVAVRGRPSRRRKTEYSERGELIEEEGGGLGGGEEGVYVK